MDEKIVVVIACVINAPLIVVSIISNALVLAAIRRAPSLRREPSTVFLASLAASDFIIGLLVQPLVLADLLHHGQPGISHARKTFPTLVGCVSICTMALVSVDGFLMLHYHMRYPEVMTFQRAIFTAGSVWVGFGLLSGLSFWKFTVYFLIAAVAFLISILISIFCYANIYRIIRQHQSQISIVQQAVESIHSEGDRNMAKARIKTKNIFIFHVLRVLGYFPVLIYMIMLSTSQEPPKVWILAETMAYLNSALNPFLFCWRIKELREAVFKITKKIFRQEREASEQIRMSSRA